MSDLNCQDVERIAPLDTARERHEVQKRDTIPAQYMRKQVILTTKSLLYTSVPQKHASVQMEILRQNLVAIEELCETKTTYKHMDGWFYGT